MDFHSFIASRVCDNVSKALRTKALHNKTNDSFYLYSF